MRRVAEIRPLVGMMLPVLLAALAGCTDPWIVQGGFDVHDLKRPTAFVEGNTPLANWIGTSFGWQPAYPPHLQPVYAAQSTETVAKTRPPESTAEVQSTESTAKKKPSWVFRKPSVESTDTGSLPYQATPAQPQQAAAKASRAGNAAH